MFCLQFHHRSLFVSPVSVALFSLFSSIEISSSRFDIVVLTPSLEALIIAHRYCLFLFIFFIEIYAQHCNGFEHNVSAQTSLDGLGPRTTMHVDLKLIFFINFNWCRNFG